MKNIKLALSLFILLAFTTATISAAAAPKWLSGKSTKYPDKDYITGIGQADTLSDAQANARAEIAKVFKVQITQNSKDIQSEKISLSGTEKKTSGEITSEIETKTLTDETLTGTEIAFTFLDKKKNKYYAFAYLNKQKMRTALAQQIETLEETINNSVSEALKNKDLIDKIKGFTKALDTYTQKDALQAKKRIVDPVAVPDIPTGLSYCEIQKKRDEAISNIRFVVLPQESDETKIKETIIERLNKIGFKVEKYLPKKETDYYLLILTYGLDLNALDRGNPQWKFFTWKGTVSITDKEGKTLSSETGQGQDAGITVEQAKEKTVITARKELVQLAEQALNRLIFNK
ncbi:MAG: hypothetical protein A2252_07045 [Elusimicrobia bacterium RIFOXYA2_FULL_39_19]|nr:MAG: hypothetical protein A2252_07045 [Elusimicrobia bacterium RIFOXYA2_FULL_39_19]